jgi:GntR family transcriptional regulator, rspAB operon transcriptional repressor
MVDRLAVPGGGALPPRPGGDPGPGRRASLTELAYDALKREILTAGIRPGAALIENELAARFGVSKTPIREALRLLVQDGWIVVLPRKGYLVRPLSLEDVREVFALRLLLEPPVAADAAARSSEELLERLRRAAGARQPLGGGGAAGGGGEPYRAAMRAARAFHLTLAATAGNGRLLKILEGLLDEVERLLHLMPQLGMPQLGGHLASIAETSAHRRIIAAIGAGDARAAAEQVRAHLTESGQTLVKAFGGVSER